MADKTGKLGLKYVVANQAQKEVTINEDLNILEMLVQATVKGVISAPPTTPEEGDMYIIGESPTGEWEGKAVNSLAGFLMGVWTIVTPHAGWRVWLEEGKALRYQGGEWIEEKKADTPYSVPPGGKTGQILVKLSDADYDYAWQDAPKSNASQDTSNLDTMLLWQPNTAYQAGDVVYSESTKLRKWYYFRETQDGGTSGISGAQQPAFSDVAGEETIDNGIIWVTYDSGAAIVSVLADTATSAKKLVKSRNIILDGDATGQALFNGAKDVTITVTIPPKTT